MKLENIISKYFLNQADEQELDQLKAWQDEASDNIKALKDMHSIFNLDMKGYKSYDTDKAWGNIENRLEESPQSDEDRKAIRSKGWMMSAAAIIAVLVAAIAVFQNYASNDIPNVYSATADMIVANFPDKTVIDVDRHSTLEVLSENYNVKRSLALNGRAYFDVEKNILKPFTVQLQQGYVTVLGTEFSLSTLNDIDEVYVTEGKVKYTINNRDFVLLKGDYIRVIDGDVIKLKMDDTQYLSWKYDKLVLENETLQEAIRLIGNHYQEKITIKPGLETQDCRITTTLENESFDQALEELKLLIKVQIERKANEIVIAQIDC